MKESLINAMIVSILKAIDPYQKTKEAVKFVGKPRSRLFLIAFGKSSVKMAKAVMDTFDVEAGVVSSYEDADVKRKGNVEFIRAGHPLPNEKSVEAAEKAIELLRRTKESDTVFVMISGGGSALFESPTIPLSNLRNLTDTLMKKGADIKELNTVRKAFSKVKGGKLLAYTPACVYSFIMSDVVGDDFGAIASGPTYFQNTRVQKAESILKKYGIDLEIPASNDLLLKFPKVDHILIASNRDACLAVAKVARENGYNAYYLGSSIQGEARESAKVLAGIYSDTYEGKNDFETPAVVISGGETTVTVRGRGRGGRNQELCLAMVPYIASKNMTFFSFATDGVDGHSSAAGAVVDGTTLERAEKMGMNYRDFLEENDSYSFFDALSNTIMTGPTGTNVMDVHVAIIEREGLERVHRN